MKKKSQTACTKIDINNNEICEDSEYFTVKLRESALIKLGMYPQAKITIVCDTKGTVVVIGSYDL